MNYEDVWLKNLLAKVDQYEDVNKCWNYLSQPSQIYPITKYMDHSYKAFRILHEYLFGPIPNNMVRHHTCRNKRCINPSHIQVVTNGFNICETDYWTNRPPSTHCKNGHKRTEENTYWYRKGNVEYPQCRVCSGKKAKLSIN